MCARGWNRDRRGDETAARVRERGAYVWALERIPQATFTSNDVVVRSNQMPLVSFVLVRTHGSPIRYVKYERCLQVGQFVVGLCWFFSGHVCSCCRECSPRMCGGDG